MHARYSKLDTLIDKYTNHTEREKLLERLIHTHKERNIVTMYLIIQNDITKDWLFTSPCKSQDARVVERV